MTQIIAEIGANHMGDMGLAIAMIDAEKDAGADTVKFQSWSPSALSKEFLGYQDAFARHSRSHLTDQAHHELIEHCRKTGISSLKFET